MASAKYKKDTTGYFSTNVWDGTYNKNCTKHYKHLRSKKSSKDLENIVKDFEKNVESRKYIKKSEITFFSYAQTWLKAYKSQTQNNTKAMYTHIIEKYFKCLENTKLQDIERIHLSILITNADGKSRTQQQIMMTFKQVIRSAVTDSLFPGNVMDDIINNAEIIKYNAEEKRPLTDTEKNAVFKADFNEQDKIFVYLLYGCGLRRQEALALTVFDFNLKKKEVKINKAHEFVNDKPQQKDPKSANGYRSVPIPDKSFAAVENYVNRLKACGKTYLFVMRNGQPVTKSSYDKMWKRIIARMQDVTKEPINGLTAHVFRHNFCTNLCYQIPKISIKKIAQLLGDTEAMVLKVYNHIILDKEDAEGAVNDAMNF